jgi:hypothetical protein
LNNVGGGEVKETASTSLVSKGASESSKDTVSEMGSTAPPSPTTTSAMTHVNSPAPPPPQHHSLLGNIAGNIASKVKGVSDHVPGSKIASNVFGWGRKISSAEKPKEMEK